MSFNLVRVDNRLIHGQILEAWVPHIKASCLLVADDEVAGDFFRETVIRMAVPSDIDVLIHPVDEIARNYAYHENRSERRILLFSSLADARRAYESGFRFEELNIGNIYHEPGKIHCARSIHLDDRDINDLLELMKKGVQFDMRCVPRDKPVDVLAVLKKSKIDIL